MEAQYTKGIAEEHETSNDGSWKIGWVWEKGVGLGKKILFAGFIVSSAPLVIPPLMVASTIAVISSVPSGLFLASYACTDKLMSKLLPPLPFQREEMYSDTEVVMNGEKEKYFAENMEGTDYETVDEGRPYEDETDLDEIGSKGEVVINPEMEEQGLEQAGNDPEEVTAVAISIKGEKQAAADADEKEAPFEVSSIAVDVYQCPGVEEDKELVQETRGLIEKIRDECENDEIVLNETRGDVYEENEKKERHGIEKVETNAAGFRSESAPVEPEKTEINELTRKRSTGSLDGKQGQDQTKVDEGKRESAPTQISSGKNKTAASDEPTRQAKKGPQRSVEGKRKKSDKRKGKTGQTGNPR